MKTAIIGYGRMGREIERVLLERGHEVVLKIDAENRADLCPERLRGIDAALEFTTPATAYDNLRACIDAGVPVVSGTTGWTDRLADLEAYCRAHEGALFYASNFSLGVNLLFRLNRRLAEWIDCLGAAYDLRIGEVHHTRKLDAPSGTAITLAEEAIGRLAAKTRWVNHAPGIERAAHRIEDPSAAAADELVIESLREGDVPGIHTLTYESADDRIELRHTIKNRRTLALGAVVAAEFLCGRKGVFTMDDLLP